MQEPLLIRIAILLLICGIGENPRVPYFLHKGFTSTYVYYDAKGVPFKSGAIHVDSTQTRSDSIVAYATVRGVTPAGDSVFATVQQFYAGDTVGFDPKMIHGTEADPQEIVKGEYRPLIYPLSMHIGDTLPEAGLITKAATGAIGVTTIWQDRRCIGTDMILVDYEKYFTWIIESRIVTTVRITSTQLSATEQLSKEWFSPDYGILKTETYFNGALQNTRLVTSLQLPPR